MSYGMSDQKVLTGMFGADSVHGRVAKGQAVISLRDPKARERTAEPSPRQREVIQLLAEGCSMNAQWNM